MRTFTEYFIRLLFVYSFTGLLSCSNNINRLYTGADLFSEAEVSEQAEYLSSDSLMGRQAGSKGAQLAAKYIADYLNDLEIRPLDGNYFHFFECEPFNYARYSAHIKDSNVWINYKCRNDLCNVMAVIEGKNTEEVVIAGAHYDHLGSYIGLMDGDCIFNGADDNASGTVALMQVAKAFAVSKVKPERTLIFAFWDGEERNCKGSVHFAEHYQGIGKIKHYINLDMVGRGVADSITCICSKNKEELYLKWFCEAIDQWNISLDVTTKSEYDVMSGSDQRPFAEADIPCLWFFSGENEETHTPYDEFGKLNIRKITDVAKVTYYILLQSTQNPQNE